MFLSLFEPRGRFCLKRFFFRGLEFFMSVNEDLLASFSLPLLDSLLPELLDICLTWSHYPQERKPNNIFAVDGSHLIYYVEIKLGY